MDIVNKLMDFIYARTDRESSKSKLSNEINDFLHDYIQLFNSENKLVFVNIRECLFIDRNDNMSEFTTRDGVYKHYFPFEVCLDIVNKHNYCKSDNRVLVNIDQIKKYDSELGRIYFEDNIDKTNLYAPMANRRLNSIKDLVGEDKDTNKNKVPIKQMGISEMKKALFGMF
ncbi:LytTR family transcriptional regulator DNA-binding domain-containing protein [Paenibacillus sp. N1-5-1-14]|uniref:LytTR family transcriptional regulator DNA-binding domain-containing protein n=1 Tax=Paenibacillus radicibacter TaxID=2972488 RepID=UPI002158AA77|nr:LytTR family transcriptional regulator DNA-binding domain-containing protein [Paenibacillus radicibacter]MCR8641454.1 LytTR family transcriptional regulator DNA-binding domain-containing protein [Paenibacillus radicibacter]